MSTCYWHGLTIDPHFGCPKCNEELRKQGNKPTFSNIVNERWEDYDKKLLNNKEN